MLTIIDYGVGNLMSIQNMLRKSGSTSVITNNAEEILSATRLIFPGMGHFDNCMKKLNESGMLPAIEQKVLQEKIPVLGICVGLQMLMAGSEEGNEKGLGWIGGYTVRFNNSSVNALLKVPHMGWQQIIPKKESPLLKNLEDASFYFAHSYHVQPENPTDILATAIYGYEFTVAVERDNILGVQFHPEKSHRFGMQLLKNFAGNY